MVTLDIQVQDIRYYLRCPRLKTFCARVVQKAFQTDISAEVSLVLTDDAFVQELNKEWRGKDMPTNVLSFESGLKPEKNKVWLAGDIVVAYQTVARESCALKQSFKAHLAHLLIHGALHLQGFDHMNLKQAKKMEGLEVILMQELGFENPYKDVI